MWMRADDYSQGYLRWDRAAVAEIFIDEVPVDRESGPLTLASYDGLPQRNSPGFRNIRLGFTRNARPGLIVCWLEWINQHGILQTRMWSSESDGPQESSTYHSFDLGISHRIVMEVNSLDWEYDRVFRSGAGYTRFVNGVVSGTAGEWISSRGGGGEFTTQGTLGPVTKEGRFLEIIAMASTVEKARTAAFAALGHIQLQLGPKVSGPVVFDSTIQNQKNRQASESIGFTLPWQYTLSLGDDAFVTGLDAHERIFDQTSGKVHQALERYSQGCRSVDPQMKLAAYFAGIEALATTYARGSGGVPDAVARRQRYDEEIDPLLIPIEDSALRGRFRNYMSNPTIAESFAHYCASHDMPDNSLQTFTTIRDARNGLMHNASVGDIHQLAAEAENILARMIEFATGIPRESGFSLFPDLRFNTEFEADKYGWRIPWTDQPLIRNKTETIEPPSGETEG